MLFNELKVGFVFDDRYGRFVITKKTDVLVSFVWQEDGHAKSVGPDLWNQDYSDIMMNDKKAKSVIMYVEAKNDKMPVSVSSKARLLECADKLSVSFAWSLSKEGFDFWRHVQSRLVEMANRELTIKEV